jgi:hypothetical protein
LRGGTEWANRGTHARGLRSSGGQRVTVWGCGQVLFGWTDRAFPSPGPEMQAVAPVRQRTAIVDTESIRGGARSLETRRALYGHESDTVRPPLGPPRRFRDAQRRL